MGYPVVKTRRKVVSGWKPLRKARAENRCNFETDDYSCAAARDSAKQNGQFVESGTLFGARPVWTAHPANRLGVKESRLQTSIRKRAKVAAEYISDYSYRNAMAPFRFPPISRHEVSVLLHVHPRRLSCRRKLRDLLQCA